MLKEFETMKMKWIKSEPSSYFRENHK